MRRLIDRWLLKKGYKSTLEQRLMRQCIMTGIFLVTGIVTMSVSTWALFSQEVFLGSFEAEMATYEIQISKDGKRLKDTVTTVSSEERTKFTLKATGSATTGYCAVIIDGQEYVTDQMAPGDKISFYVKVKVNEPEEALDAANNEKLANDADTALAVNAIAEMETEPVEVDVEFIPEWGMSTLFGNGVTFSMLSKEERKELDKIMISHGEVIECGVEPEEKTDEAAGTKTEASTIKGTKPGVATSSNAEKVTTDTAKKAATKNSAKTTTKAAVKNSTKASSKTTTKSTTKTTTKTSTTTNK